MIIAVSDIHLGYRHCDRDAFSRFLDWVTAQEDVSDLVICGDLLDMWRRNMVSVTLESSDIIAKMITMQKDGVNVHYIAGNHDYCVRHLQIFPNKFNFTSKLQLKEDNIRYTFIHGWEIDPDQSPVYFDALCHTSCKYGRLADRAWELYMKFIGPLAYPAAWLRQRKTKKEMANMLKPPEERGLIQLHDTITPLGMGDATTNGDVLVCGHTHIPCIMANTVNCGSWCRNEPIHNTYVTINGNKVQLRQFK
ncbi:MAG: UDP-2,3-diacylglucosamine diphosphatase [Chloroflexota bacterium]|nr:UDP-2,3-diacylglucosamine diphosphatase [Chloroflexota bacterium]